MIDLEYDIQLWHRATFPNISEEAMLEDIAEGCEEIISCTRSIDYHRENLDHKLANIAIDAISYLARVRGKTLQQVIGEKFDIVKGREFGPEDENGDRQKIGE